MNDFYVDAAQKRLDQIEAARSHAQAALTGARADNDYDTAAEAVQIIADMNAQEQNLRRLHQQHVNSQAHREPAPQTPEEWRVKPAEKMTWEDGLQVSRNSKYGKNLDFNDPNVVAGYHEVMRRRQNGENQR